MDSFGGVPQSSRGYSSRHRDTESARILKDGSMIFNFGNMDGMGSSNMQNQSLNQPRGIMTVNLENGNILTGNHVSHQIFGFDDRGMIGSSVMKLMADSRSKTLMQEALKTGKDATTSMVLLDGTLMDGLGSDNRTIPISVWFKCVVKDGRVRLILVVEEVERICGAITIKGDVSIIRLVH
jgi:hypothetical protein